MDFQILGPLEVWADGRQIEIAAAKQRAILAILALQANRVVSNERLVQLLWGEEPPETAANTLQVHISQLRKALEPRHRSGAPYEVLVTQPAGYLLRLGPDDLDLARFRALVEDARVAKSQGDWQSAASLLRRGLDLWRGAPLVDLGDVDFVLGERAQLEQLRLQVLEDRFEAEMMLGNDAELIGELEALALKHPTRERLCAQLMTALYRSGRQAEASAAYHRTRNALVEETGMEVGVDLQQVFRQILKHELSLAPSHRPRTDNLPSRLTNLVGRRDETAEICRLLTQSRLVTLTGAGGVGKTRLALHVASEMIPACPNGVWLIELAPLTNADPVERALSAALGIREQSGRRLVESVTAYLAGRQVLLVLDNCEHVIDKVADLADPLLRTCPELRILATSREPLCIEGEAVWRVPSLSVPEGGAATAQSIGQADSVALFCDRARLALPTFEITDSNAAQVATICQRLDGIPLAIELAASKLNALSIGQICARLDDRFGLLTGGSRTASPRQRTLRAAVDWSYELLPDSQRKVFRRAAVFAGGTTLEAIEYVCGGDTLASVDVLTDVTELVQKSLIISSEFDGGRRMHLLETMRAYAAEKLSDAGELQTVRNKHLHWYLEFAAAKAAELLGPHQQASTRAIQAELPNFRAALDWAASHGDIRGLRLAADLGEYWFRQANFSEGFERLSLALRSTNGDEPARARAMVLAGAMADWLNDSATARELATEAVRLYEVVGDDAGRAHAVMFAGLNMIKRGDVDRGMEVLRESVALSRAAGNSHTLRGALNNLAMANWQLGDRTGMPAALLDEALQLARQAGDDWDTNSILDSAAQVAMEEGRVEYASACWHECLVIAVRDDHAFHLPLILEGLARLALRRGWLERAMRLLSAADRVERERYVPLNAFEREARKSLLIRVRSALGFERAESAWREAAALSIAESLAYAMDEDNEVAAEMSSVV